MQQILSHLNLHATFPTRLPYEGTEIQRSVLYMLYHFFFPDPPAARGDGDISYDLHLPFRFPTFPTRLPYEGTRKMA
jgi:hypothetical protein